MKIILRYITIMAFLTALMLAWPRLVLAQEPVTLTDEQGSYPLGFHVATLHDPTGELTLEQVMSPEYAAQFVPSHEETPIIGFHTTGWVRLQLVNRSRNQAWRLVYGWSNLQELDYYLLDSAQTLLEHIATGSTRPWAQRPILNHRFVVAPDIKPNDSYTIYLRLKGHYFVPVPLTLESLATWGETNGQENLEYGLFFGALLIMLGYNFILYLFLREVSYFYYVAFLGFFILNQAVTSGLGAYIWGDSVWWSYNGVAICTLGYAIFALLFSHRFLELKSTFPYISRLIYAHVAFLLIGGGLIIFDITYQLVLPTIVLVALVPMVVFGMSLWAWFYGYRAARYLLLAWTVFGLAQVITLLPRLGLLSVSGLTEHGSQVGLVLMILLLSFALADRINILRQEKLTAQQSLSNTLQHANEQLEQKVAQRTELLEQQAVELRDAKVKADAANQAKSDFLSAMSHELRTPLNGILGYAQILRRRQELNADVMNGLNVIYQSGSHLLTLINDILDLSKVEARKMDLHVESLHLTSFLESVVGIIYMRAREKGLVFKQEFKGLPTTVMVDEKRLRQVLLNLLGNAVKFTAAGAVTLRVSEVARVRSGEEVETRHALSLQHSLIRFEVEDSGVGIAGHELEKIFQPFEQTGHVRQRAEGTGLGLTISRQLVQLMGGTIQVKSELGQGSLFWFELTLPLGMVNDILLISKSTNHQIKGYHGESRRVLVVDDAASNRYLLKSLLEPLGFEIAEAENGATAFDLALQFRPDLIITDVVMPEVTGFELIEKIRAMPDLAATHIIVVSASSFDLRRKIENITEYDGYLTKPIDVNELLGLMGQALGLEWENETVTAEVKAEKEIMVILPQADLVELHQYAKEGNMRKIRLKGEALLTQLGTEYHPFINHVLTLARGYEEKQLRALLEQHL